jgi:hypothetical protein
MGSSIGPPPSTPIGVLPHKDHLPLGQSDIGNGNRGQECDRQLALRMTANRKAVWDGELPLLAESDQTAMTTIIAASGAGLLAVGVSQVVARQVAAWVVSRPPSRKVELLLTALYLAVFVGIVLASLGAGLCAFSHTNKT